MAEIHNFQARAVAGRTAIALTDEHGREIAGDMIAGLMSGFLLAYSHVAGWDAALGIVHQLARENRVPPVGESPKLYCVNGREVA